MPDIAPDGFIYESSGRRVDPQSGQLYTREEDPQFRNYIDYLGYSPEQAAQAMGYDPNDQNTWGRWVQGSDKTIPFSHTLAKFIAMGALGGLGGGYLGAATGLTGAGAGGAAGGTAAGTTAAAAVPTLGVAGGTALPASLITGTAVPGFAAGGAAAGVGAGATAAGTAGGIGGGGAAPATFGGVGGAGIGGTPAIVPTLGATSAVPTASIGGTGVTTGGGGLLGIAKNFLGGKGGGGYGDYVRTGLDIAGDIEQGRSADRAQQNQYAAYDDLVAQQRYDKERANAITNANAPASFSRQVVLGDILANLQPFTYDNKTGAMTGGLGPWVLGENSRASGQALSKSALDRQLSGNPYGLPELPTPTPRKTGGKLDTALGIAGTVGGGIEAYNQIQNDRTRQSQLGELIKIFGREPTATTSPTPVRRTTLPDLTPPDDDPTVASNTRTRFGRVRF